MDYEPDVEQSTPVAPQPVDDTQEEYAAPRGAFAFVLLMLLGYVIYWAYIWLIVMGRGAGA